MNNKHTCTSVAVGTALAAALALAPAATLANPFSAATLPSGYMLADNAAMPMKSGAEAKCGGNKAQEAKCGSNKTEEAKCGANKAPAKVKEAKCGEAKCGANGKKGG